jgi:quinoprotein glucose dehydrogenase
MGPYFIPASPANGKGKTGASKYKCSWYAPGAAGGVNIDGGAAADPTTGFLYVGGQSGLSTIEVEHDPCSEHRYSQPHDSCGLLGALPAPKGYKSKTADGGTGFEARAATSIGTVSIVKPQELGGITAYDLTSGDKKWWVPNGNRWRDQTTSDPLFAGVQLPKIPAIGGQAEVITTSTLVIHGTGRSGGAGGNRGRGGRGAAGGAGGGRGGGNTAAPAGPQSQLYAFDKATGKQVGAVNIPAVNTAVPMTFMHQGKQYIVFATGQGESVGLTALTLPRSTPH